MGSTALYAGLFLGKGTESALCNFQKARGISINMIAGKATISKLFEDKFTVILSVPKNPSRQNAHSLKLRMGIFIRMNDIQVERNILFFHTESALSFLI